MSIEGLRKREEYVLNFCVKEKRVPTVILTTGGYAATPELTAQLHSIVFQEAVKLEKEIQAKTA
jgi:hypothetical protein